MVISLFGNRDFPITTKLACPLSEKPAMSKCFRCAFYKSKNCPRIDGELNNVIQFPRRIDLNAQEPFRQPLQRPVAQIHTL